MLPLLLTAALASMPSTTEPAASLVAAELAFAAHARTESTAAAFRRALAPEAIVFRPGPRRWREVVPTLIERPDLLLWHPVYAEVDASGTLGYTTGPSRYHRDRASAEAPPDHQGRFLSVWKRSPGGAWQVVFDAGDDQVPQAPALRPEDGARPAPCPVAPAEEALLRSRDLTRLPAEGDLAWVLDTHTAQGAAGSSGSSEVRIWRKVEGLWRLRARMAGAGL